MTRKIANSRDVLNDYLYEMVADRIMIAMPDIVDEYGMADENDVSNESLLEASINRKLAEALISRAMTLEEEYRVRKNTAREIHEIARVLNKEGDLQWMTALNAAGDLHKNGIRFIKTAQ